ncbi:MAG TPA: twin-arginine translocation signal domain-containing protein, partial [Pyrinomonadaceae bacterium]|nr:twin-arginine translocation signal domain-containing protein [Pyrinomonadaceae bacterium]
MKQSKGLLNRRDLLKRGALAGAGLVVAPMLNRGRFRIFANSPVEYTSKAIELVQQSLVIDMLGPFTLDFAKQGRWFANPESFTES